MDRICLSKMHLVHFRHNGSEMPFGDASASHHENICQVWVASACACGDGRSMIRFLYYQLTTRTTREPPAGSHSLHSYLNGVVSAVVNRWERLCGPASVLRATRHCQQVVLPDCISPAAVTAQDNSGGAVGRSRWPLPSAAARPDTALVGPLVVRSRSAPHPESCRAAPEKGRYKHATSPQMPRGNLSWVPCEPGAPLVHCTGVA